MKRCKCGKETTTGRCKSCSNRDRAGKYKCKISNRKRMKSKTRRLLNKEKNPMWKGDNVGLKGLHQWVRKHKPKPEFCESCNKKKPYDLANISGEYKRDINDFEWICRRCHMKSDGRLNNLKQFKMVKKCASCGSRKDLHPTEGGDWLCTECVFRGL